jgi:hypothetical protein
MPDGGNDHEDLDVFFLETIQYAGSLTSEQLVYFGRSRDLGTQKTQDWIRDAANRGLIIKQLKTNTPNPRWQIPD